jgi:glycine/serine hydroxymethyltransferase
MASAASIDSAAPPRFSTTHKTLHGPRGGLILDAAAAAALRARFPIHDTARG